MSGHDALIDRWHILWPGKTAEADAAYRDLITRYAEPHRAYHTLDHVAGCLAHFDATRHLAARPAAVELAIWFHDAVYDPRRGDNEARSAELAEAALSAVEADDGRQATRDGSVAYGLSSVVGHLIRLTTHAATELNGDAALLCDIDLAILGAPAEAFDRYDAAIRREYAFVPDDAFRQGRAAVLGRFLERPRIYHMPFFFNRLEERARRNLARVLRRYQNKPE